MKYHRFFSFPHVQFVFKLETTKEQYLCEECRQTHARRLSFFCVWPYIKAIWYGMMPMVTTMKKMMIMMLSTTSRQIVSTNTPFPFFLFYTAFFTVAQFRMNGSIIISWRKSLLNLVNCSFATDVCLFFLLLYSYRKTYIQQREKYYHSCYT